MCCQNDPYLLSARVALAQLKQVRAPQRRQSFVDVAPGVGEHNTLLVEAPAEPRQTQPDLQGVQFPYGQKQGPRLQNVKLQHSSKSRVQTGRRNRWGYCFVSFYCCLPACKNHYGPDLISADCQVQIRLWIPGQRPLGGLRTKKPGLPPCNSCSIFRTFPSVCQFYPKISFSERYAQSGQLQSKADSKTSGSLKNTMGCSGPFTQRHTSERHPSSSPLRKPR